MFDLHGKYNTATVFTDNADQACIAQVINLLNQESIAGSKIRIMPDCCAGAGCVVGTTMTITDKIIPNLVGVDIGCGMLAIRLKAKRIDLPAFDSIVKSYIPSGSNIRAEEHVRANEVDIDDLVCYHAKNTHISDVVFYKSLGTLGGGNHFIELDKDNDGHIWLVIHSGSRRTGKDVAEYYQERAYNVLNIRGDALKEETARQMQEFMAQMKAHGRQKEIQKLRASWQPVIQRPEHEIPYAVSHCEGQLFDDYIHDMGVMQHYAALNRELIAHTILKHAKLHAEESFETIHNYIDLDRMILRKGAVSAQKGERILIPMNMRDGSLICIGKGNPDWNYSAPHGAGRLMSRSAAKESISMSDFKKSMEGVFTTCVSRETIDESPFAYKPAGEIMENIKDTVDIERVMKPIYNFKAGLFSTTADQALADE